MTRLPIPGADNGSWGDILNDFLRVEHNDDGTLKTSYVDSSQKGQAGGIAELDGGGTVPASQLPAGAIAGDATAVQKGIMRLTGDLGGTADSPTVPGLAGKADSADLAAKVDKAGDTMSGQLNIGVNSASAVVVGDGANFVTGISLQNRAFVGYDTANYLRLQGGSTKGIQFGVNNSTFGLGTVATIDTTGQLGIGVLPTASNGYLQLPSSTSLATGGIAWGTDTNLYRAGADTLRTDDNLIVAAAGTTANSVATIDATQTLTNKRVTRRISSTASDAAPTPNIDTTDVYLLTALATAATFGAPTGTPTDGQSLIIRIKDNGTARTLGWNAAYRVIGTSLPTTTLLGKTLYLGFLYNSADAKWDCLAVSQEA